MKGFTLPFSGLSFLYLSASNTHGAVQGEALKVAELRFYPPFVYRWSHSGWENYPYKVTKNILPQVNEI